MKITLVSQSNSIKNKSGRDIARTMFPKFAHDRKLNTKDEFSSRVKVGYAFNIQIDGPKQGTKSKVRLVGSYYQGKSLVGLITYPLNAVAYDMNTKKSYLFVDKAFAGEISTEQFVQISAALRDFIDGSSEHLDTFLTKLDPNIEF